MIMDELLFVTDSLEVVAHTFKSVHPSLPLKGLLLAVVWNALGILSDLANWQYFEYFVLCRCGFILDLIGRIIDVALCLPFHERSCCLGHLLLLQWC